MMMMMMTTGLKSKFSFSDTACLKKLKYPTIYPLARERKDGILKKDGVK